MGVVNKGITESQLSARIITDGDAEYYSNLPPAPDRANDIYIVLKDSGVRFVNKKNAGLYKSDGVNWTRLADLTNMLKSTDVINDLISTNADKPLSANQGKLLQDTKLENVIEDTTPQLGGDLDINSNNITGAGNININGEITANLNLGNVFIGDSSNQSETRGLTLDDISQTTTYKLLTTANNTKLNNISLNQAIDLDTVLFNVGVNNLKITNSTHTGDVTGSTALTITDQAVTDSKLAHTSTGTVKGRTTAGTGSIENITIDTDLTTVSSNDDTLASAKAIKTYVDNNSSSSIADESVTNSKLAHISTSTVKGRLSANSGDVEDVTVAALKTAMNITKGNVGLSAVQNINVKNDWTQNASKYIASSQIRAVDGNGLKLYNDAGNSGLLVTDNGRVEASNGFKVMGDWFRVNGNSGIYWDNHGGGWNMEDSTYMRCYGNKLIYTANDIRGNRFVDNQNTNRYIDASGQSQLEGITFNGNLIARRTGFRGGDYSMIRYYQYAYNSSPNYNTVHGAIDITCEQGWNNDNLMIRMNNQGYGNKTTYIYGNLQVTGSISKGSGSFDIAHPDPKKKETHRLRHYFVETPSAGGNIYKYQIKCKKGKNYIDLPDYFKYLNKDSLVWVNPVKHFGRAWGEVKKNGKKVKIVTDKKGTYNILIFGDRKDETAMKDFNEYGIEYKNKK
tara:strand:- start:16 stop:2055 length:2040 start_codon:yes stop_codon:yes gene_type:complete